MAIVFEAKSEEGVRLAQGRVVEGIACSALYGGATLADEIRAATGGFLGSLLLPPDFSDEIPLTEPQ